MIDEYIDRGTCYVLRDDGAIVGEMILLEVKPGEMEIMNIAIDEGYKKLKNKKENLKNK